MVREPRKKENRADFLQTQRLSAGLSGQMAGEAETVGGWRIAEELGSGHFAKVKRGIHITTNKQCAIKIVKKPAGAPPAIARPAHHTCVYAARHTCGSRHRLFPAAPQTSKWRWSRPRSIF